MDFVGPDCHILFPIVVHVTFIPTHSFSFLSLPPFLPPSELSFLPSFLKNYLFKQDRKKLIYSPNGHNSQSRAALTPEATCCLFFEVSFMYKRSPSTCAILHCVPGTLSRRWTGTGVAEIPVTALVRCQRCGLWFDPLCHSVVLSLRHLKAETPT